MLNIRAGILEHTEIVMPLNFVYDAVERVRRPVPSADHQADM